MHGKGQGLRLSEDLSETHAPESKLRQAWLHQRENHRGGEHLERGQGAGLHPPQRAITAGAHGRVLGVRSDDGLERNGEHRDQHRQVHGHVKGARARQHRKVRSGRGQVCAGLHWIEEDEPCNGVDKRVRADEQIERDVHCEQQAV